MPAASKYANDIFGQVILAIIPSFARFKLDQQQNEKIGTYFSGSQLSCGLAGLHK